MFGSRRSPAVAWSRTSPARVTRVFYLTHFWVLIHSGCCFVSRSCHYLIAHSARTFLIPGLIKTENQGAVLWSPVGRCTKLHSVFFFPWEELCCARPLFQIAVSFYCFPSSKVSISSLTHHICFFSPFICVCALNSSLFADFWHSRFQF